jgi:hypothetical protein
VGPPGEDVLGEQFAGDQGECGAAVGEGDVTAFESRHRSQDRFVVDWDGFQAGADRCG